MFQGLRFRLLAYYLAFMAAILSFFSLWVYVRFNQRLFQQSDQIDQNLESIAQIAAPYFNKTDQLPTLDSFNSKKQKIEWFDEEGQLIASKGELKLSFPPQKGKFILQRKPPIRIFTDDIFLYDSIAQKSFLEGYIRVSEETEDLTSVKYELLSQLTTGILLSLGLSGAAGFWLTRQATQPVEQAYQYLKQFTADASHELRNPLAAIQASIEVMLNHPERVHPKDMKKLGAIASATEQMSRLTQDLLFLARTDGQATSSDHPWKPLFINQILQNLVDLLEPLAEDKNISLNYHISTEAYVTGDQAQLHRLFSNLLQNAIQYTTANGQVSVSLAKQNRFCCVSVQDTGIGIASEEIPFVFDRFWRADKARTRREGGTGLGLSIALAIAQRHGGKITVSSQLGEGSCFKVYLPIDYGAENHKNKPVE